MNPILAGSHLVQLESSRVVQRNGNSQALSSPFWNKLREVLQALF